jgi:hypothetical protein
MGGAMITKINVVPILKGHFRTLLDRSGKHVLWQDVVGFYVIPAVVAILLVLKQVEFQDKYINIGIVAHTVFIPLLVNVLFLIFNIVDRGNVHAQPKRKRLLEQLYDNVCYLILISVASLAALAIYSVKCLPSWFIWADRGILYCLSLHAFLTSLMVVKRIHILLSKELEEGTSNQ